MNRRMMILMVALLGATGCGRDPRHCGETGRLQMEVEGEKYHRTPVAPIAVGSSTALWVEFPGEWDPRVIDVQSSDETWVPSQTVTFTSLRCEFLRENCANQHTVYIFDLKPQHSGKVRLAFYEKGELVDAVTLEAREAKTLDVDFFDYDGNPLPENPTVRVGSWVELRAAAFDENGERLVVRHGFKFEGYAGFSHSEKTYTDGGFGPETIDYTLRLGELVKPFQITFK